MPEKVYIHEDLQIIKVDSFGDITFDDLKQSLVLIERLNQEKGISKVLVDASQETSFPDTLPIFNFGSQISETISLLKVALITSPKTDRELRFLETVAKNRGANIRVFETESEALEWLNVKKNANSANEQ